MMSPREPIPFSGNPLDRAHNLRGDDAWLAEQLANPASRFLPFSKLEVLSHESEPALLWLTPAERQALSDAVPLPSEWERLGEGTPSTTPPLPEPILLGIRDGIPHFALDVTNMAAAVDKLALAAATFADPRALAASLPLADAGIVAQARTLIDWHAHHHFCSVCGGPTSPRHGGAQRSCDACGASHFPRINPAVIMVVERDDRCLLARRPGRPPGNFSCVAGYVDPGETIEEAVAREVHEEVGLAVDHVTYFASQPWPFSSSLMIGCFAHATTDEPHVDAQEIEEARWFTRPEVQRAVAGDNPDLIVSAPVAISYHLIRGWAELGHR